MSDYKKTNPQLAWDFIFETNPAKKDVAEERLYINLRDYFQWQAYRKIEGYAYSRDIAEENARDIAQKTAYAVFQALPRYEFSKPYSSWLWGIFNNTLNNYKRDNDVTSGPYPIENAEGHENLVDTKTIQNVEDRVALEQMLSHMPEDLKWFFERRFLGNQLSYSEIARMCGESLGTVKKKCKQARLFAKNFLEGKQILESERVR